MDDSAYHPIPLPLLPGADPGSSFFGGFVPPADTHAAGVLHSTSSRLPLYDTNLGSDAEVAHNNANAAD